jgi:excisionase family DNA binding protein
MRDARPVADLGEPSYTVRELADAIGVHRVTVHRWCIRGLIEYWRTPTGRIRIPRRAAQECVTVHTVICSTSENALGVAA